MGQVIAADVLATNGVIHVINAVLVPPTVSLEDFLVLCREMNPDVDPVKGGKEDAALTEEDKTDTNGEADKDMDMTADADTADMAKEDSASSVISTMAGLIGAALVTVVGM